MTEAEWLGCDDPTKMLGSLGSKASGRKLRLFAAACCHRVHRFATGNRRGLEDAAEYLVALERYAEGLASADEWDDVLTRLLTRRDDIYNETCDLLDADFCTFLTAIDNDPPEAALWASVNANIALTKFARRPEAHEVAGTPEAYVQAAFLHDIFGNLFRPATPASEWRTADVVALARGIYDERAFDRMAILADALQDAGCENEDILNHCRGSGPHVRGCWLVDTVLNKE